MGGCSTWPFLRLHLLTEVQAILAKKKNGHRGWKTHGPSFTKWLTAVGPAEFKQHPDGPAMKAIEDDKTMQRALGRQKSDPVVPAEAEATQSQEMLEALETMQRQKEEEVRKAEQQAAEEAAKEAEKEAEEVAGQDKEAQPRTPPKRQRSGGPEEDHGAENPPGAACKKGPES